MIATIKDGQLFAYDEDQVRLYESRISEDGHRSATKQEIEAHLNPVKSLDELAKLAQSQVDSQYQTRMQAIADGYPAYERESWPVQLQEARDVQSNPGAPTPWLDACARQRGMEKAELVARVLAKDVGYRQVSGFLTGVRQWHEDCIALLLAEEDRESLEAYDHTRGWQSAETQSQPPAEAVF